MARQATCASSGRNLTVSPAEALEQARRTDKAIGVIERCPLFANGVNRHAVRAPVVDLEEPEGATKWGFVSGCMAGLRHRHDSLPKSKESQIRALEKGRHQHSSSLPTLVLTLALEGPDPANGGKC